MISGDIAARNEIYSFQVAVRRSAGEVSDGYRVEVSTDSGLAVELRLVEAVASRLPAGDQPPDDDQLRTKPGLFPDLLTPLEHGRFSVCHDQWNVLWCTVRIGGATPGTYPVRFSFARTDDKDSRRNCGLGEAEFTLDVLDFELPPQKLLRLEWLHCDCLSAWYAVPAWSEEHWRIVGNFMRNAFGHGINVLYTPLWTPPLDTEPGGERPTCQLLEIERLADDTFRFDFSRLERWIDLARETGFESFAMSHLFTQWGAGFSPKIIVRQEGRGEFRLFGWDVPATDPRYRRFLTALMPRLLEFLRRKGIGPDRCFFSVSDEPELKQFDSYRAAAELARPLLEGYPTLEALSNYEFFRFGLVDIPVPANDHIEPFVGKVSRRWSYYCACQQRQVPNRFFSMPPRRERMMGVLSYVYDLDGFLHWGYNFYFSQFSRRLLDPFQTTDAGGVFPSGDSFLVYPGRDGNALDSIRHEIFREGLQDLRALRLLERKLGRTRTLEVIQEGLATPIRMDHYPRSDQWLVNQRKRIYRLLLES